LAASAKKVPGIVSLRLEPLDGKLTITFDPAVITSDGVTAKIQDLIDHLDR
jgi:hypothetical protein